MTEHFEINFKDNPYTTDNFELSTNKDLEWDKLDIKFVEYPPKKKDGKINVGTKGPYMNPLSDGETFNARIEFYSKEGDFLRSVFLEGCTIEDIEVPRLEYGESWELISNIRVGYKMASEQRPGRDNKRKIEFVG